MVGQPYMLDPAVEAMPRDQLKALQDQRLRRAVRYSYERVEMYREKFDMAGITPDDIKSTADLNKLPFTTKEDLRERYPLRGLLAVSPQRVIRYHMTTGTTGKPTVSPLTADDVFRAETVLARCGAAIGIGPGDTAQLMFGYGLFAGAVLAQPAFERMLGAAVIPAGGALPSATQLDLMRDFHPDVLAATPSFLLHIIEVAKDKGIELNRLGVKGVLTGAEPSSEETRIKIAAAFGAVIYADVYGMCELGPHVCVECPEHRGLHFNEEAFIPEIIDPDTGESLGPGEKGMLVITCLMKEAMPILRYQTKDITWLDDSPCVCGRTHVRIQRIMGRTDDMVKVKGVNIFPSQVESVIRSVAEVKDSEFQMLVDRSKAAVDSMTVKVEAQEKTPQLTQKLQDEFQRAFLGAHLKVELVDLGSLPRFSHKAQRLVDTRQL
ncbi:MAG: phenylacetate--CoA ligase [Proteobacteria bacterium]|nr:phenylacetate--CoA ligase [Pseudomonadota bacterium]MBU1741498.1 phenylacetate--CoA ligase [Pseudomonadota bacterium]